MPSTSIQVSLLRAEVDILEAEANRQMTVAVRIREEAISRGEKVGNLKSIAASTVARQIIRAALPPIQFKAKEDKKGR